MVPVGVAAGAIIPGHALDVGKPALIALDEGVPFTRSLGLAVWERLYDLMALLTFAGAAGLVWATRTGVGLRGLVWPFMGMVAVGAVGMALLTAPGPALRLGERLLGGSPAPAMARRAAIAGCSLLAIAIEAGRAALVAHALGWQGPVWGAPVAFLVGSAAGIASLVPGGMGVAEWSAGLVLSQTMTPGPIGRVAPEAAAIVVVDRLLAYYLLAIVGGLLMAMWPRLFRAAGNATARERPNVMAPAPRVPEGREPATTRVAFTWVVLPAYNEAKDIGRLIGRIAQALPAGRYHVLLVDDGSRDGTAEVARRAAEEAGCTMSVLQHRRNEGLPSALLAVPLPGVRDYTSGFRAYRASTLRQVFERFGDGLIQCRTFACTAEVLLKLGCLGGVRFTEAAMTLRYDMKRGASKIRVLPTVVEYLKLIIRLAPGHPVAARRLLWAAALAVFMVPLAAPLTDGDSHYYAAIAQQMVHSRDWLTPRHPDSPDAIVDKPPLTLWMMALSFKALGVSEVAARSWQVVMGLAILWLTMDIGRLYLSARAALRAGWILLASALFWYAVLVPQQDVATALFATLAFWAFMKFRREGRPWFFYLVWAALAGELLSRGPLGVALAGAVLVTYLLISRTGPGHLFGSTRRALNHTAVGLGAFGALGLPWYVAEAVVLGPRFVEVFFTGGNARFFSGEPAARGLSLVLGYVALLAVAFLPWSGWVPPAFMAALRRCRARGTERPAGWEERTFVLVWAVVGFIAPHLIAWRVIRYLLPTLPALALLVAEWLDGWEAEGERFGYWLTVVLLAPLVLAALALPWVPVPSEGAGLRPFAQLFLGIYAAGAVLYAWLGRRSLSRGSRTLAATALAAYLALGAALAVAGEHAFPRRLEPLTTAAVLSSLDSGRRGV